MRSKILLIVINFFQADIGGGLGPYLSTWLAGVVGWNPFQIGSLNMASRIAYLVFSGSAGAVVDRVGRPRWMMVAAAVAILGGTLTLLYLRNFWFILATQVVVFGGGALGGPALNALTLGVVGKRGYAVQQGWNLAADHAGNVISAALVIALAGVLGAGAAFAVLGAMAVGTVVTTLLIRRSAVDEDKARGRAPEPEDAEHEGAPPSTIRALLKDRRLLLLVVVITLFNLGNDQMLPLMGQRMAIEGKGDPTLWMATWVLVAQLTMIPMAWIGGWYAGRRRSFVVLLVACVVLAVRGAGAAFIGTGPYRVMGLEVLDGIGAGLISVATPIAIADLTYGGGRTQTAFGGLGTVEGAAAALSAILAGAMARHLGWAVALGALAIPPAAAVPLLIYMLRARARRSGPWKRREPAPAAAGDIPRDRVA